MPLDPDRIYHEVLKCGEEWADAKSAYEALDDNSKSVLADITSNFMDGKMSKTEAEMRALASGDYKNHLAEKQKARKAWLHAQVRFDSIKMLADLRRSEESTRRAEINLR